MSALIVQHGWGDHCEILYQTNTRHNEWAKRHNVGYHCYMGQQVIDRVRKGAWAKIPFIIDCLETTADQVIWLDADTCVRDLSINPLTALDDDADIGMIFSPHAEFGYNAGIMFIRNSEATKNFYKKVWELGPMPMHRLDYLADETRINNLIPESGLKVQTLDFKWNYFYTVQASSMGIEPTTAEEECYIRAWHGIPAETVRRRVAEYIAKWP